MGYLRSNARLVKDLACEVSDLAASEGLVLFVGAGINGEAGCLWPDLVGRVLERALKSGIEPAPLSGSALKATTEHIARQDLYAQASIASVLLGPQRFVPALRSAVYAKLVHSGRTVRLGQMCRKAATSTTARNGFTENEARDLGYLVSIARLCLRREIKAVVTYNYDTLLEYAIQCVGNTPPQSVRPTAIIARHLENRRDRPGGEPLKIYHVHGCLPPPGSLMHLPDCPVVLAQQDYARTMQEPYEWETSTPLHFLRNFPCLFLGLSMTDWNMLRLLQSAVSVHRRIREQQRLHCLGVAQDRVRAQLKERLLAGYGVSFHAIISDRYDALMNFTDRLYFELEGKPEKTP